MGDKNQTVVAKTPAYDTKVFAKPPWGALVHLNLEGNRLHYNFRSGKFAGEPGDAGQVEISGVQEGDFIAYGISAGKDDERNQNSGPRRVVLAEDGTLAYSEKLEMSVVREELKAKRKTGHVYDSERALATGRVISLENKFGVTDEGKADMVARQAAYAQKQADYRAAKKAEAAGAAEPEAEGAEEPGADW